MATETSIEWTHFPGYAGKSWNPVIGCRHVAEGCRNCYAEKMSKRLAAMGQADYASILDDKGRFNGRAITRPETLDQPLRTRKPTCWFVNSMSDLFHDDVPDDFIAEVYAVMARAHWHQFIILTKRPKRMRELFSSEAFCDLVDEMDAVAQEVLEEVESRAGLFDPNARMHGDARNRDFSMRPDKPLPNVIHGYSAANQADLESGINDLLQTPSALRCLSLEPLIGPIRVDHMDVDATSEWCQIDALTGKHTDMGRPCPDVPTLDWIIVGCESGPGARGHEGYGAWAKSIIDQCAAAGVPCFHKQMPVNGRKSGDPSEWPEDIRVRQFPALQPEATK